MNCLKMWNAVRFQGYHLDLTSEENVDLPELNVIPNSETRAWAGHPTPEAVSEDITSVVQLYFECVCVSECLSAHLSSSICVSVGGRLCRKRRRGVKPNELE